MVQKFSPDCTRCLIGAISDTDEPCDGSNEAAVARSFLFPRLAMAMPPPTPAAAANACEPPLADEPAMDLKTRPRPFGIVGQSALASGNPA